MWGISMSQGRAVAGFFVVAMLAAGVAGAADPNPATLRSDRGAWPLYRQWTPAETQHFARWIEHIYMVKTTGTMTQRLAKLEGVLTDPEMNLLLDPEFLGTPSNPQIGLETIRAIHPVVDCGKLTVTLTAYYAYRRGLPWMATYVRSGDGTDIRTSSYNLPSGESSVLDYPSVHAFLTDAVYGFCTGNYRVEPDCPSPVLSDTAPVAIDRKYLIPGTMFYLDGHVLILAHVDPYGEVYFLDATTSPTRDIYTHNGFNAVSGISPDRSASRRGEFDGCFRGFLMFRYPIAETDSSGRVTRVRRRTDAEMVEFGYSTEQYTQIAELTESGHIEASGLAVPSFHDLVRLRLRTADRIAPVALIAAKADEWARLAEAREAVVQAGWAESQANGPITFPERQGLLNVFRGGGRWDAWSSASHDIFFRRAYNQLGNWLNLAVTWYGIQPEFVDLRGLEHVAIATPGDLALALHWEKDRVFAGHTVHYTNSAGAPVALTLLELERRLYDLSFDPNHPPELRWGAREGSAEVTAAPATFTPTPSGDRVPMWEGFRAEAYYRTLTHRDTEESYLRGMFTAGFPVPAKLDEHLAARYRGTVSPPLIPVYDYRKGAAVRTARSSGGPIPR